MHEEVNELLSINRKPRKYDPQEGDVLEWETIRLEITRVTEGGEVLLEEVDETTDHALDAINSDQYTTSGATPLGVWTWATMDSNPTPDDLIGMLEDGWELIDRDWEDI